MQDIGDNMFMCDNDWVDQKFKLFRYKKYMKVMMKMQKSGVVKGEHLLMARLKILAMIKKIYLIELEQNESL